jgi:hypothetical protein
MTGGVYRSATGKYLSMPERNYLGKENSMAEIPVSRVKLFIEDAFKWSLMKKGIPLGPPNDMLSNAPKGQRARIVGLSLGRIISLREGEMCDNKDLAYADHYLQARTMTAHLGLLSLGPTAVIAIGYETKKLIWQRLGILHKMASDDQCVSPVPPDSTSVYWGLQGAVEGVGDFCVDHPEACKKPRR